MIRETRMSDRKIVQLTFPQFQIPMSEFVSVAKVGDIPVGEGRAFELDDSMVAIFNADGHYHAIDDMCPHMGASLAAGHFDQTDCTVTCPWHAWRFDTRDGTWCDNRRLKVDCYHVRVQGTEIQVALVEPEPDDAPPACDDSGQTPPHAGQPQLDPEENADGK